MFRLEICPFYYLNSRSIISSNLYFHVLEFHKSQNVKAMKLTF